ncbi:Uncharacterized protein PCOAH_00015260 [Plasmodium coatneyi]|uniref:Inhibitor of growth protein N-terminal histone-binding domain-containing protein n=1 Tax=Plasmodium coatneyi TaxID=208452 RepID=A0A1B1DW37_9APIC|nr:Uncharacterized protein PCOAH_00015260 [Plasmodium coatneyi]ANQ06978.1 Uncharacterized protein PCOAH_00015260 [Plasmodium coatneyi]
MSDSAQIYMENVLHITGYLHRLLFLMKELDFKEHKINKQIQEKEEIYLENLNYLSKNRIDRQGTYLTGQSSMQNEDLLLEFENENCEAECVQLNGGGDENDVDPWGSRQVRIKEEQSGGEDPAGGGDPTGCIDPTVEEAVQREDNSHHPTSDREKSDAPGGELPMEGKTNSGHSTPVEPKGVKQEVPTDDEKKGEAEKEEDRAAHNIAELNAYPNAHPCGEPANPALHNGDDEGKNQVCRPIQRYTEEELEDLLNEIISDREQCIALLKEKICINNQISYLIKTDFDRVKSQHDKLFVEMEMNGESPPYMHNTSRNRNAPTEWDHQDNLHERSTFQHDQFVNHTHGNDIPGNATHGSGSHVRSNHNRNTHQFDSYDMEKTKEDDADSSSIKAFGRKHSQMYDEDYNPYTVGKNKKTKKSKKSRGGENATANTSTKLKTAPDKEASGISGGVHSVSESVLQSVNQSGGKNASQSGTNKMRIRLLSMKIPPQEGAAPLAAQTDQADGTPPEGMRTAGVEEATHLSTSEGKADVAKLTNLGVTKTENEDHVEEGPTPHGEQPNGNDNPNENDKH